MAWYHRLLNLVRSNQLSTEIEREIEFHIAERADELRAQGLSAEEALYQARRRFGNRGLQQERVREIDIATRLDAFARDVKYAWRSLRRTTVVSVFVVVTFALGIGATAAIFSVVNAVLIRPLPYRDPDRVVRLYESLKDQPTSRDAVGGPTFTDWREQATTLEGFISYQLAGRDLQVVKGGDMERVSAVNTSANLFTVLGHATLLGRGFSASEDGEPVVVLSEGLWRRSFGADPSIIGKTVTLDQAAFRVIGVMPSDFAFPAGGAARDLWVPYTPNFAWTKSRSNHFISVVARLKPDVTVAQANTEMKQIAARLEASYPEQANRTALVLPYKDAVVGDVRRTLFVLLGAVGLVLLIACANVTSLLLARGAALRRIAGVKLALGATRWDLIRQRLLETGLLALIGAVLGSALAFGALRMLVGAASRVIPIARGVPMDQSVFLFVLGISVVCGIAAGVAPALQMSNERLAGELLGAGGRFSGTKAAQRTRNALVVGQLALSLVLLAGAGLLIRGFAILTSTPPGFTRDGVVTARLSVPAGRYDGGGGFNAMRATRLYFPVLERLRAVPGVKAAAITSAVPIDGSGTTSDYWIDGRAEPAPGTARGVQVMQVSPGYFSAMGIPVRTGGDFAEDDGTGAVGAVLVNEAFARREFPGENAVGRRLHLGRDRANVFAIKGVVGDVRQSALDREPSPQIYFPYRDDRVGFDSFALVVRFAANSPTAASLVRTNVASVAADVPLYSVRMMDEVIHQSLVSRRFNLTLLGLFAATAVILAACGLYGVLAYAVMQRSRELAIRIALGARPQSVIALVVRHGIALAGAGIVIGLAGAIALSRTIEGMLYGVGARDPITLIAVAAFLVLVALLATYLPARRAAGADPMVTLRLE
jgi:putative ABC transport system permease protein